MGAEMKGGEYGMRYCMSFFFLYLVVSLAVGIGVQTVWIVGWVF